MPQVIPMFIYYDCRRVVRNFQCVFMRPCGILQQQIPSFSSLEQHNAEKRVKSDYSEFLLASSQHALCMIWMFILLTVKRDQQAPLLNLIPTWNTSTRLWPSRGRKGSDGCSPLVISFLWTGLRCEQIYLEGKRSATRMGIWPKSKVKGDWIEVLL